MLREIKQLEKNIECLGQTFQAGRALGFRHIKQRKKKYGMLGVRLFKLVVRLGLDMWSIQMGLKLSSWCAWLSLDMWFKNFILLPIKPFYLNLTLVQIAGFLRVLRFLRFEIKTFGFLYTFLKSLKSFLFLFRHVTDMLMVKSLQFFTENPRRLCNLAHNEKKWF